MLSPAGQRLLSLCKRTIIQMPSKIVHINLNQIRGVEKEFERWLPHVERALLAYKSTQQQPPEILLETTIGYLKSLVEYNELRSRLFPTEQMSSQERLTRVAAQCGLAMPKIAIRDHIEDDVSSQSIEKKLSGNACAK
jgi:hypothetical protein